MAGPTSFGYQNLGFGAGVSGAAAGTLTHIATDTLSSQSQINFTSLGAYKVHLITFENVHTDGDNRDLFSRALVGGSEQSGASDYSRAWRGCAPSYFYEDADPDLHSLRHIPEIGNAANESLHGRIYMYNAVESSKMTAFTQEFTGIKYDTKTLSNFGGGTYQPKNTLSGIRFYLSAGSFTSGTVKIYGLEES